MPEASASVAVNAWSCASAGTFTVLHQGVSGPMATFFSSKTGAGAPFCRTRTVQPFRTRVEWKPTSRSSFFSSRSTFTAPSIVTFFTPPMPLTGNQNCLTVRVS